MDELSPVAQFLKKARRRCLLDLVLDQSALALSIAMAGAILLLLVGTSLLEWYWIALLALASLAAGLYRFRKRVPSEYVLAQRVDWKMNLADALSTAKYFENVDSPIIDRQRQSAEEVARTIDPRVAVPFTRSRFLWPAAGLALVACGLFAVRYAVTHTMSLEPSLVKMAYDTFFGTTPQQQARNAARKRPVDLNKDDNSPLDPGDPDEPTPPNDQAPDAQLQSVETPDINNALNQDQSKSAPPPQDRQDPKADNSDKDKQSPGRDDANQDKKGEPKEGKLDDKPQSDKETSTFDKLKDALANMINKMKSGAPKEGQQPTPNPQDSKAGGQEKSNQKDAQKQSSGGDTQGDEQGQGEKADQQNAKSEGKSQDKENSPGNKSGIGYSDGDKSAKEAEQQQAMGKISEIIGKRSATVSGEVMVEVGSTRQQLKTPWAQKQATHVEAGSEIHRDEVPLMYQPFVQQYFEEIRKGTQNP